MSTPENNSLGQQIRALRERHGLTQVELAAQLGVRGETVSKWELGKEPPQYHNLVALAAALRCRIMVGRDKT